MPAPQLRFDDADTSGQVVTVEAHPQAAVTPGTRPGTAIVNTPDGRRFHVVGDYRDVHARIQDAAAQAHAGGDAPRANTGLS
jgi:hypothetical protein